MNIVFLIAIFIIILFALVTFHELGHFAVSKWKGIPVIEFGIGFPPRLFAIKRGGTEYSFNMVPIGAFVKTVGEDDPTDPEGLAAQKPLTRFLVYAAGPVVNIVVAFVFLSVFFSLPTEDVVGDGIMIVTVTEGSPAAAAGFESGDVILEIDDQPIRTWENMHDIVNGIDDGQEIAVLLDGKSEPTMVAPKFYPELDRFTIGVIFCWGQVTAVDPDSPADKAGIIPGDAIYAIDDTSVYNTSSLNESLTSSIEEGQETDVRVLRGITTSLTPEYGSTSITAQIGATMSGGVVDEIESGSPADVAGIKEGDLILSVNAQPIYDDETLNAALKLKQEGEEASFQLLIIQELSLTPELSDGMLITGFQTRWVDNTYIESTRRPVLQSIGEGGSFIINMPGMMVDSFSIIKEDPSDALVGPVGAGQLSVEAMSTLGLASMVFLAGLISLGLALFNLFPIPPLDGGGMLIAFIEGLRRGRRLSPRTVQIAYTIGTVFMITIFVVIMYSDILRLIKGEKFFS